MKNISLQFRAESTQDNSRIMSVTRPFNYATETVALLQVSPSHEAECTTLIPFDYDLDEFKTFIQEKFNINIVKTY